MRTTPVSAALLLLGMLAASCSPKPPQNRRPEGKSEADKVPVHRPVAAGSEAHGDVRACEADIDLFEAALEARTAARWRAVLARAAKERMRDHMKVYELALQQLDEGVRLAVVERLSRSRATPTALHLLTTALGDDSVRVRLAAVEAAGRMDHPEAVTRLRRARRGEVDPAVLAAIDRILAR